MNIRPEEFIRRIESLPSSREDPDPWLAAYLEGTVPMEPHVKAAMLLDQRRFSRQFLLPLLRPMSRAAIMLIQVMKIFMPRGLRAPKSLHRLLAWALSVWVTPEANYLILRHFNIGTEVLDFIARNTEGIAIKADPIRPTILAHVRDNIFWRHDLNLFNFLIDLNSQLKEQGIRLAPKPELDFAGLSDDFGINELPDGWSNFIDLQTAIEFFAPVYQLFLTDLDFWRASNSLQHDETIAMYVATLLRTPGLVVLVQNRHPLIPLSTLKAGFRLLLHGLAAEQLHTLLRMAGKNEKPVLLSMLSAAETGARPQ